MMSDSSASPPQKFPSRNQQIAPARKLFWKGKLVRIGRNPSSECGYISNRAKTVSWEHAMIQPDEYGAAILHDLDSTNGTYVNGRKIHGPTRLMHGDCIDLGPVGPSLLFISIERRNDGGAKKRRAPARFLLNTGRNEGRNNASKTRDCSSQAQIEAPPIAHQTNPPLLIGRSTEVVVGNDCEPQHSSPTRQLLAHYRRESNIRWIATVGMIWMLMFGTCVGFTWYVFFDKQTIASNVSMRDVHHTERSTSTNAWQQVIERVEQSVVTIDVSGPGGWQAHGTGFVCDSNGWIVTNFHVIEGAHRATVTFDDQRTVRVLGFLAVDRGSDLAILKIEPIDQMPPALDWLAETPSKGTDVVAIGAPRGYQGSVTEGIISSVRAGQFIAERMEPFESSCEESNGCQNSYHANQYSDEAIWLETTTRLLPGSSGGPLLDQTGTVVGVSTFRHDLWCNNGTLEGSIHFASSTINLDNLLAEANQAARPLRQAW